LGNRESGNGATYAYAGVMDDVIDVGCGDLRFWEGRDCAKYVGIDISPTILEKNMHERPQWKFILMDAQTPIKEIRARIVLCLDILFHILDDAAYIRILENLCTYSKEWIFIFTWAENPLDFRFRVRALLFDFTGMMFHKHPSRFSGLGDAIRFLKKSDSDGLYQKYRDFTRYVHIFQNNGFVLVASQTMPRNVDYYHNLNVLHIFRKV
jgi:hypothetical protein